MVVFGQSLLLVRYWGWVLLQYFVVAQELSSRIYRVCVQIPGAFLPACAESRKNSLVMSRVESLLHGSKSWLLSCRSAVVSFTCPQDDPASAFSILFLLSIISVT